MTNFVDGFVDLVVTNLMVRTIEYYGINTERPEEEMLLFPRLTLAVGLYLFAELRGEGYMNEAFDINQRRVKYLWAQKQVTLQKNILKRNIIRFK